MTDKGEQYRIKFFEHNTRSGYVEGTYTEADAKEMARVANILMPWRFKYTVEPVKEASKT